MSGNLLDKKGCQFSATISESGKTHHVYGKIQVEEGRVFLCQEDIEGAHCNDLLGYSNSWCVSLGDADGLKKNNVTDFKIIEEGLFKIAHKWAIQCDGSSEFREVLKTYCRKFHKEVCYDFNSEDRYYGFDGLIMRCNLAKVELSKCRQYTLKEFKQAINYNLETKSNEKSNSVKVQRKTTDVTEGERFTGISVSGRTSKIAVSLGHLSYTAVSNECF